MNSEVLDAVIIGSGQAGNPLAVAAAKHGWKTALVERRFVGGVCTNDGCTPTKTMVASARVAAQARRGEEYGVQCGPLTIDLKTVKGRADSIVQRGRKHIQQNLTEQQGLELIFGEASFAEAQPTDNTHVLDLALKDGGTRQLRARRVFIDTGERPQIPEIEGLPSVPFMDSSAILQLEEVPGHLLILGGGYIALEFAQMFRRFGAAVTVVEHSGRLISHEDDDIAACMADILREDGITFHFNAEVQRVEGHAGAISLTAQCEGKPLTLKGTHLLVATGRTPNVETLQLDRAGVELNEHGYIQVNERLETTTPGIWALGDVKGPPAYTHIAYDDFRIVRANLMEGGSRSTKDRIVPYAIFTDPELGRVGMTEAQAREAGKDILVFTLPMKTVARAAEMAETRGMMKAVVDRETDLLLGASILGTGGGEIATELQLAMLGGLKAGTLRETIFTHPVLAEGFNPLFKEPKS